MIGIAGSSQVEPDDDWREVRACVPSKIAGDAFDLPVAVADRLWTAGAIDFLGMIRGAAIDLGAASLSLGERTPGGRRARTRLRGAGLTLRRVRRRGDGT
jgi:hypothetical protein